LPEFPITNAGGEDCAVVTALALDIDAPPVTPLQMQMRLALLGMRPAGLMVDVTNYVMLETGQPTHAYDRDHVDAFEVRHARSNARLRTLDGQDRTLQPEDLLICNEDGPIALAGIMGGNNSGVGAATTRFVIESAQYRAARVRRTASRLGLRTEASQRFEKSLPPALSAVATGRILHLLDRCGAVPRAVSRFTVDGDLRRETRNIEMSVGDVSQNAGADIPDEETDRILTALGFTVRRSGRRMIVGVPPYRSIQDISMPIDVVEEVLRVYGYANIAPVLPNARISPVDADPDQVRQRKARHLLAGRYGFAELQTYLWMDDAWLREIGFDPAPTLRLKNPIAPDKVRLRTTLVPNLLKAAQDNANTRTEFGVFEIGRVILAEDTPHREVDHLAGVSVRSSRDMPLEEHYRAVKGALSALVRTIGQGGVRTELLPVSRGDVPWHVPDLTAGLLDDSGPIGRIGVLHGPILDRVAPGRQVIWFELELDRLTQVAYPIRTFTPYSEYPSSSQDFSILWGTGKGFAALEDVLDEFEHHLIQKRELLLVYKGKGLAPGMASYTFRYALSDSERTLDGDDLDDFREAMLDFLKSREISLRYAPTG
ncbi:MAG: phenylalanine--tRNA ligase subunit beta, partial [Pseudomonadota bacterium]